MGARPEEMYRSNVDGTRSLLAAARKAGVERCVYTSTVGCIGMRKGGLGDPRDTPAGLEEMQGPYKRSKFLAEQVALQFAGEGFPVVIVNPTAPVGDHDFRPTPTGKIVVDFLRGAMPAYLDTGLNVVYVGDVAAGHLLACERGRVGERYILGGENLTLQQIFGKLEEVDGKAGADGADSLCGGICGGSGFDRLGLCDRARSRARRSMACGWRARKCGCGTTRPRASWDIRAGPAGGSAAARRGVVSGERLL